MIRFIFFFSICFATNPLNNWIDQYSDILKQDIKSVSFQISVYSNFNQEKIAENLNGNIIVGKNKQFRYEVGPRTVISDGKVWKSYDERTNQIFIQEIDKKLEKKLFSWVKLKMLKAMPLRKNSDGGYKISLFSKHTDVRAYFSSSNDLKSVVITEGDFRTEISKIHLSLSDSLPLNIGTETTPSFDLR